MPVTERLYYSDSHLIEFEARVVDVTDRVSGWTAVVLDRTAFYPTGGGQPSDTGTLNGARVVECIDDGDNGVLHVVQGAAPGRGARLYAGELTGRDGWTTCNNTRANTFSRRLSSRSSTLPLEAFACWTRRVRSTSS